MSFFKDIRNGAAADIIFLVDSSWSIGKEHFQLVREFLYDVIKSLAVGENDFRFALVKFNGNPHTEFLLNTYHSKQEVLSHISNLSYIEGSNQTGTGLEYVTQNHLTEAAGSRAGDGVPQVIVVLTDGHSDRHLALPPAELKSADVNVFAIGVEDADEGALKEIASEPFNMHVFNLENVTSLHDIVGNLVSYVRSSVILERAGGTEALKDITGNGNVAAMLLLALLFLEISLAPAGLKAPLWLNHGGWIREKSIRRFKNKGLNSLCSCLLRQSTHPHQAITL